MAPPFLEIPNHQLGKWVEEDPGRVMRYIRRARLAGNQVAAWRASMTLVDSFQSVIWSWCERRLPDEEVEEAVGEAREKIFLALKKNPPELVNFEQLYGWVRKIVYRHCADRYRNAQEQALRESASLDWTYEDGSPAADKLISSEAVGFEFVEYQEIFDRNLKRLNDEHQIIIHYRFYEGYKSKAVCEILRSEHGLEYKPDNIDQIYRRFKKSCRSDVEEQ